MRTGAACGQAGNYHEAGFYGSDAEFRGLILPFIEEGVAAGEPVVIGYDTRKVRLLRSWLTHPAAVIFIVDRSLYASPAAAIENYRQLFERHVSTGAEQIRIAGDVPHPGNGGRFDGWDRYESAVNVVWQDYPVWSRCLYDAVTVPNEVRDVVERTHPRLLRPDGDGAVNQRYQNILEFRRLPPPDDPLEQSPPLVELVDPAPAEAREQLVQIAHGGVSDSILEDLLIGVTELVTNAQLHGQPPATVRMWAAPNRVVVHVHDTGPGAADPLAGLVPRSDGPSAAGLGLWLVHQLDLDIAFLPVPVGFTVRLRGGQHTDPSPSGSVTRRVHAGAEAPVPPAEPAPGSIVRAEYTVRDSPSGSWAITLALTWYRAEPDLVHIAVSATPPHPALTAGRWLVPRDLLVDGGRRPTTRDGVSAEPTPDAGLVLLRLDTPAASIYLPTTWLQAFLQRTAS